MVACTIQFEGVTRHKEFAVEDLEHPAPASRRAWTKPLEMGVRIATALCLAAVVVMSTVIGVVAISQIAKGTGDRDFIAYWSAGQLMIHGGDPYDASSTLQLERSAGWTAEGFEIMRNPPVAFFLVAPLGFVSLRTGAILWTILLLACLVLSVWALWITFGRPRSWLHLYCFCLPPVLTCITAGQFGIFLLLGISLFLFLHTNRPFLAGTALLVCAFKPHLFLPFGLVLLLWIIYRRHYRILAGFAVAVLAASSFALIVDVHAFSQYARMIAIAQPADHPFVPTLSRMFRHFVHPESLWLQFLPAVAGCGWAVWYFLKHRSGWDWLREGLLLLVISVGCAPYAWFTDESVLVPAILAGLYLAQKTGRSLLPFGLIACVMLAELFKGYWITTTYFLWSIPAWLAWYLYATREPACAGAVSDALSD